MKCPSNSFELWSHRRSGVFYAVWLSEGQIRGGLDLSSAERLARRQGLSAAEFEPAVGMDLAGRRHEFAVVDQW